MKSKNYLKSSLKSAMIHICNHYKVLAQEIRGRSHLMVLINLIRPGLLAGIKSRPGEGGTKNHTFENPLLIVKML